jgi:predicted metal-dependent hydrolase
VARHITTERIPATNGRPALELRRSSRRRKTANAYARDGVIVVQLPAGLPREREERIVDDLVRRVTGAARAEEVGGDEELLRRAERLADRYLDGVRPASVRWSDRMERRHGSCTTIDRSIRISSRLASCPGYVLDYVLVHELAHLRVPGHPPAFWELVERYPEAARAKGFLEGLSHAAAEPCPADA